MKKVFHLGSLLKIHRGRNILELTISPTDSGQPYSVGSNTIASRPQTRRNAVRLAHAHASQNIIVAVEKEHNSISRIYT